MGDAAPRAPAIRTPARRIVPRGIPRSLPRRRLWQPGIRDSSQ